MENEIKNQLGDEKEKEYQPAEGWAFKLEPQESSFNEGSRNKNYVFNNCSVTINEEGKAIEILQEQKRQEAKAKDAQNKMLECVVSMIGSTLSSLVVAKMKNSSDASASKAEPTGVKKAPVRKRAPAKKASAKVGKKK